jgi:hypothetical protein
VVLQKPPSFLAMIKPPEPEQSPEPEPPSTTADAPTEEEQPVASSSKSPPLESPPITTEDAAKNLLLTSPQEEEYIPFQNSPPVAPIRRRIPSSRTNSDFLASSVATQEELSNQLTLMARQLKSNATHFASSLEKDKAAMEGTEAQLESNVEKMGSTQVEINTLRQKSKGTTWLVMGSILVVVASFVAMVLLIRVTRYF